MELAENYENFICDNIHFESGFVDTSYMKWAIKEVEPTASDYFYPNPSVEIFFKNSPYAKVNMNMDITAFDIQSRNYRMEAIILFTAFIISSIFSIFCYCFKNETFFKITEEQRKEIERINQ